MSHSLKIITITLFLSIFITSCGGKFPGGDARKSPPDPKLRVQKNIEEGRGFRLSESFKGGGETNFEFASSNELWRASLDTIDFMPLMSANYSGGIIITDWYSDEKNSSESIKITIRFLTNEIRSDALEIKVFYKNCKTEISCTISEKEGVIEEELKREILKKATIYLADKKEKNKKPYKNPIK